MEKRTSHYSLEEIQRLIREGRVWVTGSAKAGAIELGILPSRIYEIVLTLSRRSFYKSMTTHHDHTLWQDVYRHSVAVQWQDEPMEIYIKLQIDKSSQAVVISFKEL